MSSSGLSHVTFIVSDLDRMEHLLTAVLGAVRVYDSGSETFSLSEERFFLIGEGTLYPALHRLERRGLIKATWGVSDNNRQAKYYSLAKAGRERLQSGTSSWHRFVDIAGRALRATAPVPAT